MRERHIKRDNEQKHCNGNNPHHHTEMPQSNMLHRAMKDTGLFIPATGKFLYSITAIYRQQKKEWKLSHGLCLYHYLSPRFWVNQKKLAERVIFEMEPAPLLPASSWFPIFAEITQKTAVSLSFSHTGGAHAWRLRSFYLPGLPRTG